MILFCPNCALTFLAKSAAVSITRIRRAKTEGFFIMSPCEEVTLNRPLARHEHVQDLIFEREQVVEQADQLVGAPSISLAEVLELVLKKFFSRPSVKDQKDDVEEETRSLDINLPKVGLSVDRRNVFLGLVSRA